MKPVQEYVENNQSQPREFTGTHMFLIMLLFFGVIISVNFTMAYLAFGSWTGLVVKNSYVASQKFNKTLIEAKKQKDFGWTSSIKQKNGILIFTLSDKSGRPINDISVSAHIGRPTHEQEDKVVTLVNDGATFKGSSKLQAGYWRIKIIAKKTSGLVYRLEDTIYINEGA